MREIQAWAPQERVLSNLLSQGYDKTVVGRDSLAPEKLHRGPM